MNDNQKLYRFLNACEGSWRNTVFVFCKNCPYSERICSGYFLTTDRNGVPILYPVEQLQKYSKESLETDECIGVLSREAFEALYHQWLIWQITDSQQCNILQALQSE